MGENLVKNKFIFAFQVQALVLKVDVQHFLPGNAGFFQPVHELKKRIRLACSTGNNENDELAHVQGHIKASGLVIRQPGLVKIRYDPFELSFYGP